jgi:hypothetical protein
MFSNFVTNTLGFTPTRIDPDVYYRKGIRPNGDAYYEYILVYVDDVLAISLNPTEIRKKLVGILQSRMTSMVHQPHI